MKFFLNILTEETYINSKKESIMMYMDRYLKSVPNKNELLKKLKEKLDEVFEAEVIRDIENQLFETNTTEELIAVIERL